MRGPAPPATSFTPTPRSVQSSSCPGSRRTARISALSQFARTVEREWGVFLSIPDSENSHSEMPLIPPCQCFCPPSTCNSTSRLVHTIKSMRCLRGRSHHLRLILAFAPKHPPPGADCGLLLALTISSNELVGSRVAGCGPDRSCFYTAYSWTARCRSPFVPLAGTSPALNLGARHDRAISALLGSHAVVI
jgi:hypothetical protein